MQTTLHQLVTATKLGKRTEALALISHLLERDAALGVSWLGVAKLAILNAGYKLARICLNKAVIASNDIKSYLMKWSLMTDCFPIAKVVEDIEEHLNITHNSLEVKHLLATLNTQVGQVEAAKKLFKEVLSSNALLGETWLSYIALLDRKSNPTLAKEMESICSSMECSNQPWHRKSAFFNALARLYENQQKYQKAFEYFSKSNQLQLNINRYNEQLDALIRKNLYSLKNESGVQAGIVKPNTDFKLIFIVGQPRSGTTLIESLIASKLVANNLGEINAIEQAVSDFIGKEEWASNNKHFELLNNSQFINTVRKNYLAILSEKSDDTKAQCYIDKSLNLNRFLPLIELAFPDALIINIQRDLDDVIWSCFKAHFSQGLLWSRDLNTIKKYLSEELALTKYLLDKFKNKANLLDVNYEELVQKDERVLGSLSSFLGLKLNEKWHVANNIEIKTSSVVQVRGELHTQSIGQSKHYCKYIAKVIGS